MTEAVKDRGPGGQGSIVFRQNLEYPREPGHITYYPPEPSGELKKQVRRDRGGGISMYTLGFIIVIIGFLAAREFSDAIEIYAVLIPVLLVLGLISAIMYLSMNNVALAKLSRTLPAILLVCLILLYVFSIFSAIMDLMQLGDGASENAVSQAFEELFKTLLNPAFFLMSAGIMMCRTGGTMLWTSSRVMNEFIPGMIIIETSHAAAPRSEPEHGTPEKDVVEDSRPCGRCGKPLEFIEEYGRHYCYECKEYAPKE